MNSKLPKLIKTLITRYGFIYPIGVNRAALNTAAKYELHMIFSYFEGKDLPKPEKEDFNIEINGDICVISFKVDVLGKSYTLKNKSRINSLQRRILNNEGRGFLV